MRLLTYTFIALVIPLAAVTRAPAGRAPRAVGGGAGDLRRLGAAPEPAAPGRRVVAGRAARPSRVAAAGVRHPVSGFSVRARRLFLKRALTLVALVGAALLGVAAIGAIHSPERAARAIRATSASSSRSGSRRRCSIRRSATSSAGSSTRSCSTGPTTRRCAPTSAAACSSTQDVAALLDEVCAQLAPALSARIGHAGASAHGVADRAIDATVAGRRAIARRRRRAGRRAAALRARGQRPDRRPPAALGRPRRARRDRRRWSAAASTRSASRTSATRASCASRRSASSPPRRSCARCARRSIRTSCSTR